MSWRALALIIGVLGVGSGPARAQPAPCSARLADWKVSQGDLQPGRGCGSYVAGTNGATIAYSFGQLTWKQPVTLPYRVTVTWRRLGSDMRSLELHLLGAVVMFTEDKVALWIDDASFELDGWHPLPGYRTRVSHTISVVQRVDAVEVEVDGRVVGRWSLAAEPSRSDTVSVAFKGHRGAREKIWFRDFVVEQLGRGQSQRPATAADLPK